MKTIKQIIIIFVLSILAVEMQAQATITPLFASCGIAAANGKAGITSIVGNSSIPVSAKKTGALSPAINISRNSVDIKRIIKDNQITASVYPNPVQGILRINMDKVTDLETVSIIIFDNMGRQVGMPIMNRTYRHGDVFYIDFKPYKNGQYFIKLIPMQNAGNAITIKVMKNTNF